MIEVVGHRVLLKISKTAEKKQALVTKEAEALAKMGFQIATDKVTEQQEEHASQDGIVVGIGPMAWKIAAYGGGEHPWVKVGDRVVFPKFTGKLIVDPDTEEKYMVVNDDDILAKVN